MKKIARLFSAVLSLVVICSSCDYNELDPSDMVGPNTAFKDTENVHKAVVGIYGKASLRQKLSITEYIGDDCQQGGDSGGAGTDLTNWVYVATSGDVKGVWEHYYSMINQANRVLYYGPQVKPIDDEDLAYLNESLGVAYFFRAYAHFELLNFFSKSYDLNSAGIPYVSHYHVVGQPKRETVAECYDQIMTDLDRAYDMIRLEKPDLSAANSAKNSTAYVSKAAVDALRARVALYSKNYTMAQIFAQNALDAVGGIAKLKDVENVWEDKSNQGIIFKLSRPAGSSKIGSLFVTQDYSSIFLPTNELRSIYGAKDVRSKVFFRMGHDRGGSPAWMVTKWFGNSSDMGRADEKMFRAEEMLLIIAECYLEGQTPQTAQAERLIHDLRKERIEAYTPTALSNVMEELIVERRRELVWEGHRLFDARRLQQKIQRGGKLLSWDDYRMVLPIPQAEIDANNGITAADQNYGY